MNTINQQLSRLNQLHLLATAMINQLNDITEHYFCDDFTQYADTMNSLEYSIKQVKRIRKECTELTEQYEQAKNKEQTAE